MNRFLLLFLCPLSLFGHLVIHMDINRTIIASDVVQDLGLDDIVNLSLAKKYISSWEEGLEEMSYYDYIYTVKYPGPRRDRSLRKQRRTTIHGFIDYLAKIGHPYHTKALEAQAAVKETMEGRLIFPSFYKLIDWLEKSNESYTLVFRTFGTDLDRIIEELGWDIPKAAYKDGKLHTNDGVIATPQEALAYLKAHKWIGVRDDYFYWNGHNELKEFGKQFPSDSRSIFFDDNIEMDSEINIVAPIDVATGLALPVLPLIEQGVLVPVITVDAILDEDYFIRYLRSL